MQQKYSNNIAKNLKNQGYNPILIARNEENLINKSKEIGCSYEICDVLERAQIDQISKGTDRKYIHQFLSNSLFFI